MSKWRANPHEVEPITDDELLYRRIPVSMNWYENGQLSPEAFDPRPDEHSGISIYRAKYKSLEEVARGKSKKGYFVAVYRSGELRANGIEVVPRPVTADGWDAGHAEIPALTSTNRETTLALEAKLTLAQIAIQVVGPFLSNV